MTQDEIRKLLGGYATDALTADERRILFEAALEDQDLFNALQNEDALKELLDDPVLREQVRRALGTPAKPSRRPGFSWRKWAFGVALPAAAAVIAIVVMNRADAPKLVSMSQPAAPTEVAPKLAPTVPAPQAQAIPAPVPLESARRPEAPVASAFSAAAVRPLPPDAPLYQGPLVRYSVIRSGPDGNAIRVEVTTGIAGYLALYRLDAAGNSTLVYPAKDPAALVEPDVTIQIPITDTSGRLRLVVVPAAPSAAIGQLGGAVNGTALGTGTPPLPVPPTPLIVDIPLAAN